MKKLPLGVSTFEIMQQDNYLYIDKTRYIYQLVTQGRYYFLSRPRRFGKSLLISTLKALFLNKKELFNDLWIARESDYVWKKYPVIDIDFSLLNAPTADQLEAALNWKLDSLTKEHGFTPTNAPTPGLKLESFIKQLATKERVVILIDEYDKPILDVLQDTVEAEKRRSVLRGFYDSIKSLDQYLQALFITGVTKFSKTSIFSGMNNVEDISLSPISSALLGYTHEELLTYFSEYIDQTAQTLGKTPDELTQEITLWYNGYRFSDADTKVYNPFSIINFFRNHKLANYWFSSGTPSFLVELLKKQPLALNNLKEKVVTLGVLNNSFDLHNISLIILLHQTGYLTIQSYDTETSLYTLNFPNEEVRMSMAHLMVGMLAHTENTAIDSIISLLKKALFENDLTTFFTTLQSLLANIPYNLHIERENYYHSLFHFMAILLGMDSHSEVLTSNGRIDLVLCTTNRVFIFEFKFNKPAQEALDQIKDKKYHDKYSCYKRPITLAGVSFNYHDKKLALEWAQEE